MLENAVKELNGALEKVDLEIEALEGRKRGIVAALALLTGGAPAPKAEKPVAKAEKPAAVPGKKRGRPRKVTAEGGESKMTVRDAIVKVVNGAPAPMLVSDLIPEVEALSGGAVGTIRTQVNLLAKAGKIAQINHPGRGYLYGPASAVEAAPAVDESPVESVEPTVDAPVDAPVEPEPQA